MNQYLKICREEFSKMFSNGPTPLSLSSTGGIMGWLAQFSGIGLDEKQSGGKPISPCRVHTVLLHIAATLKSLIKPGSSMLHILQPSSDASSSLQTQTGASWRKCHRRNKIIEIAVVILIESLPGGNPRQLAAPRVLSHPRECDYQHSAPLKPYLIHQWLIYWWCLQGGK